MAEPIPNLSAGIKYFDLACEGVRIFMMWLLWPRGEDIFAVACSFSFSFKDEMKQKKDTDFPK
jgi:hypothetical protein